MARAMLLALLAKSRGVHFAALGAVLYAVTPRPDDPYEVKIASRDLDALHVAQASRAGMGPLSKAQIAEIDERAIEDAVLYREALRYGLDRGDNVVRQHLVQKMLLLAEDMAGATRTPNDDDLRAYFEATRARWTRGETIHFVHVFASRHDAIVTLAPAATSSGDTPPLVGEPFPASRDVSGTRESVAAVYGDAFADAVFAQDAARWGEPVESKFGWHLVKVVGRTAGRPAEFEEVRQELALEWAVDRRHRAIAAFLTRAFERYDVTVDGKRRQSARLTERLARRLDPSAED
jgi:hypothetical protein